MNPDLAVQDPERIAYLYPGELIVSQAPCTLSTVVGSCVSVFLWDARRRAGGMNHYLLPRDLRPHELSPRFGNTAIRQLVDKLAAMGSEPAALVAKVFGGAHVLGNPAQGECHLGRQNAELALEMLESIHIPVLASAVGGTRGRRVVACISDGSAWVKEL